MSKPLKPWFYLLQQQPNDGDICWCKQFRDFPPVHAPVDTREFWLVMDNARPGITRRHHRHHHRRLELPLVACALKLEF